MTEPKGAWSDGVRLGARWINRGRPSTGSLTVAVR